MSGQEPERVPAAAPSEAPAPASDPTNASAQAYARGDLRTLRAERARGAELSAQQRAALTLDPAHVLVLVLCALGLLAIGLQYLGAGR